MSFSLFPISYLLLAGFAAASTVKGRIALPDTRQSQVAVEKYTGKISGEVERPPLPVAGVWLTAEGVSAPANCPPIVLSQRGYQFTKSLVIVPVGCVVRFPNEDEDYHNVYSLSKPSRFDLGRYKKGQTPVPERVFKKPGFISLHCEIHEHMRSFILVVDTPYFTLTDTKGNFTIRNVPAGEYTIHAQLDRKTVWQGKISVKASGTTVANPPRK